MVMYGTRSGTIRARISFVQNFHQLLIKKKEKKKRKKEKEKEKSIYDHLKIKEANPFNFK
jgi:hypothetical protein